MKVVINRCYGGFGVSLEALKRYMELRGYTNIKEDMAYGGFSCISGINPETKEKIQATENYFDSSPEERTDPALVQAVEELGEKSWGEYAELSIVEIPDDVEFHITEYDGVELIRENHRSWC